MLAVGASFGFVGAGYIGGKWFVAAKYGLMFGLVQMFASLGSAVGQPLISALLHDMTWQQLLAGFGAFGVLLTLAFAFVVRNPVSTPEEAAAAAAAPKGNVLGEILARPADVLRQPAGGAVGGVRRRVVRHDARGRRAVGAARAGGARRERGLRRGAVRDGVARPRIRRAARERRLQSLESRKWPAVVGMLLQTVAVALFIYGPSNGKGASVVVMFAVGLFAGTHMLGFTIAGESVPGALIGSASAIVNGICFIVGGVLEAVPGWILPDVADLGDFQAALWVMPAVLLLGALAALALKEEPVARSETQPAA